MIICSLKFRNRLDALGVNNVGYIPIDIIEESGTHVEGYFAMNIIGRLRCMDRSRSQFTFWRNRITRIQSLSLDIMAIHDCSIFRLHEYPELVLVEDRVATQLRDMPGVSLLPAEGWSDEHLF